MFGAGGGERRPLLAQMTDEGATAAGAGGDDLATVPRQQADRRLVDLRRQHLLGATGEQRHAPHPLALGGKDLWPVDQRATGQARRCQAQHRCEAPRQQQRQRPRELGAGERQAEEDGLGSTAAKRPRTRRSASGRS
jgi:hypothetical protein